MAKSLKQHKTSIKKMANKPKNGKKSKTT